MLESYQVELKVWEIYSEETWNRKDINYLKNLKKLLELINQFNGDTIKYLEKNIDFFTLRFNSDQFYKCCFKKFLEKMSKTIDLRLTCIKSHLDKN